MLTADLPANLLISRFFRDLGGTGPFLLFLALAVISLVFIAALAPETTGRPLEDIRSYWETGGRRPEEGVR